MAACQICLSAAFLVLAAALPGQAQEVQSASDMGIFVAGVDPSQRPVDAPEITEVSHDADWYDQALTGVSQPYPGSLRFLEDQGNWFTPFTHPGMNVGPYDIRGWHSR